jgi:hypothetical protein
MSRTPRIIFPVAIDPAALLSYPDPDHKQTHVVAATLVRDHGILSLGPGDAQDLVRAVDQLVGRPQQVWSNVIRLLRASRRSDDQARGVSLADFLASAAALTDSADQVRLAIVPANTAAASGKSSAANVTEQVALPDVDESQAVVAASGIGTFRVRTARHEIADQLLKPLASRSSYVRIMDPQIFELFLREKRTPAHVEWLLSVLAEALPAHATISVIGTLQSTWRMDNRTRDEASIRGIVETAVQSRRRPLTARVTLAQAMKQPLKNRYLWFDCTDPFDVLHNFIPLEADPLKEEFRVGRQKAGDHAETQRVAAAYENAKFPAMVSVTVRIP